MSAAQDRNLSLTEKLQLKMHLVMCDACRNFSKQIGFLRAACKRYAEKPVPDEARHIREKAPRD